MLVAEGLVHLQADVGGATPMPLPRGVCSILCWPGWLPSTVEGGFVAPVSSPTTRCSYTRCRYWRHRPARRASDASSRTSPAPTGPGSRLPAMQSQQP